MDGWNTILSYWGGLFSGAFWLVSGSTLLKWMIYRENPIKMDDLGVPPQYFVLSP